MIIKKIGVVTGDPFDDNLYGKIVLIDTYDTFYVLSSETLVFQNNSKDAGYRQATLEEIKKNWDSIYRYWQPQIGDKVQIIQRAFQGSGFIKSGHSNYWLIDGEDKSSNYFHKLNQMVIHPEHGWNAGVQKNQEPEMTSKEKLYNSLKHKVKEELKIIDPGLKAEIIEACVNQPQDSYSNQEDLLSLVGEFTWSNTVQGTLYWHNIFNYLGYTSSRERFKVYLKFRKNVREEFDRLKEPVRQRILELCYDNAGDNQAIYFKYSLHGVLGSIRWSGTKEGYNYWKEVYDKITEDKYKEIETFKQEEVVEETALDLSLKASDCDIDTIYLSLNKGVKDELSKIPSSVKDDILYNIKHHSGTVETLGAISRFKTLDTLIGSGFVWRETKQYQNSYWSKMQNYASDKDYFNIVPYSEDITLKENPDTTTVEITTSNSDNSSSIRHDFISDSTSTLDFNNPLKVNSYTIYGQKSLIDELRKCPIVFIKEILKEYGYSDTQDSTITIAESNLSSVVTRFYYCYFNLYWKEMLELLLDKKYYLLSSKQSYYKSKKSSSEPSKTTSEVIIFNQPNKKSYLSVDSSKYDQTPLKIKQKPKIKLKLN